MKNKLTRIYTRFGSPSLTPEDVAAVQRVNQSLPFKGGHIVVYHTNASKGSILMQAWNGDNEPSLKLRNRNGQYVRTGVSPYTLCDHLDAGLTITES